MTERGHVVRKRSNWVSGWLLTVGVPAFVIGMDPLAAHHAMSGDEGWNTFMLTVTGCAAVSSMAAYVVFARPVIVLGPTHVMVRNPLAEYVFPRSLVSHADRGLWWPRVVVEGRTIRLTALEESLWQTMHGAPAQEGIIGALSAEDYRGERRRRLDDRLEAERVEATVRNGRTITWTDGGLLARAFPIDWVLALLASIWLGYVAIAWLTR